MGDAEWRQPASLLPKHPQAQHLQQQQQLQQLKDFHLNSVDLQSNSLNSCSARSPPIRQFTGHSFGGADMSVAAGRRPPGMPPFHPHMPPPSPGSRPSASQQSPSASANQSSPGHTRSLSQPAGFFSLEQLPPLSPPLYRDASSPSPVSEHGRREAAMEARDANGLPRPVASPSAGPFSLMRSNSGGLRAGESLPLRKAHRHSYSDIPFGYMDSFHSLDAPSPLPPRPHSGFPDCSTSPRDIFGLVQRQQGPFIKQELDCDSKPNNGRAAAADKQCEDETMDALIGEYMNLDALDAMNSSEMDDKHDDLDSRASGTRNSGVDTSETESETSVNESGGSTQAMFSMKPCSLIETKERNKRSAVNDITVNTGPRHCRSLSVDSCLLSKFDLGSESPKLPPSPGVQPVYLLRANSLDGTSDKLRMELESGDLSGAEMKKIMANAKLAEIAATDPKRAKRILANRQSAARSKERKQKYISELEHKVQTLQTEATSLSTQLTVLQRDSAGLTSQNRELKLKLQAMEQQAQLRDALNEALSAEVRRLKLSVAEMDKAQSSNSPIPQPTLNPQLFHIQQQLQQMQQQSAVPFSFQPQDKQAEQRQQQNPDFQKECQHHIDHNTSGPNKEAMDTVPMTAE